jgi:hypothetical protein
MVREQNQKRFCDIYSDADSFLEDMGSLGLAKNLEDDDYRTVFFLLFAKYGDTGITGYNDETRWKMRLQSVIWQYGPEWKKKLSLQEEIRGMSVDDAMKGAVMIYNHAINPSTEPSTGTDTELDYINEQTQNRSKKSRVDAIATLWDLMESDVTASFLNRFKDLFTKFTLHDDPLYLYN